MRYGVLIYLLLIMQHLYFIEITHTRINDKFLHVPNFNERHISVHSIATQYYSAHFVHKETTTLSNWQKDYVLRLIPLYDPYVKNVRMVSTNIPRYAYKDIWHRWAIQQNQYRKSHTNWNWQHRTTINACKYHSLFKLLIH